MSENNELKENKHISLNKHKRKGKILSPPYEFFENIKRTAWSRDLLPEYLWMDGLHQKFENIMELHQNFNTFLDIFDPFVDKEETILLGLISDFGKVPIEKRKEILKKNTNLIKILFVDSIGHVLVLYPDCPAAWLIPDEEKDRIKENFDYSVNETVDSVIRLFPGKDNEYCREVRILSLQRLLKHKKIFFSPQVDLPKLLVKYPYQLTTEEKEKCERLSVLTLNMYINSPNGSIKREFQWSKHFWRQNLKLSPCNTEVFIRNNDAIEINQEFIDDLNQYTNDNIKLLKRYLYEKLKDYEYDLYDPSKDEVIIGLFARIIRLYIIFLKAPELWTRDVSNIFIRCILDSTITLKYLLKQDNSELYQKFIEYGQGKEKLQILHSQDTYPDEKSAGTVDSKGLATELGSDFFIESLKINLGNWIDKNVRDMAVECDMHKEYALIYNPTSEDVHGSWISIKKSSLMNCMNPLHRFHRIPRSYNPIDPNLFDIMANIIEDVIETCENQYHFPSFNNKLKKVQDLVEKKSK